MTLDLLKIVGPDFGIRIVPGWQGPPFKVSECWEIGGRRLTIDLGAARRGIGPACACDAVELGHQARA
jgi:hypothetical protein